MADKPFPAKCADCKHSQPEDGFEWNNRCHHPIVNSRDSWALANNKSHGSSCRDERERGWFAPCGMKGKLWEAKTEPLSGRGAQ
jgi:hypothetical protein